MILCYQKDAINAWAKFKTSFNTVGAINQKKIELRKYAGTSKEEFLIAIKQLWQVINTNDLLLNNYLAEIVISQAG